MAALSWDILPAAIVLKKRFLFHSDTWNNSKLLQKDAFQDDGDDEAAYPQDV